MKKFKYRVGNFVLLAAVSFAVLQIGGGRLIAKSGATQPLSDSEASQKSSAIWDAELEGNRDQELRLARSLEQTVGPEWSRLWAQGVINRITSIGKPVSLAFTSIDGGPCDIGKMKGKVVLVNFWATWCSPCIEAMPALKETFSRYHAQGLEVIGISWDNDKEKLLQFLKEKQISWPQYFDGTKPGKWGEAFGIGGVPYVLLIDRSGKLRYFGADEDAALKIELPKLIAE